MNKSILTTIVVALIVGVIAFFGGLKYQQMQRLGGQNGNFIRGANRPGLQSNQNGQNFRPVLGAISSLDDKSLTVKMPDGSSKIILFGSTVAISKTTDATKTDLQLGTQVGVFGTNNSDGSVTAQAIQINPQFNRVRLGQ